MSDVGVGQTQFSIYFQLNRNYVHSKNQCASDCLFKTEFVTSDNEIIVDEVKKGLEQFLGPEWQSLMPNMIETCKSRPAHKGHNGHKGHKEHKCNPVKEMFLFCIHEQILEKCPDSLWKNGKTLQISLLQKNICFSFFSIFNFRGEVQ